MRKPNSRSRSTGPAAGAPFSEGIEERSHGRPAAASLSLIQPVSCLSATTPPAHFESDHWPARIRQEHAPPTSCSVSTPGGLNASVEMVAVLLGGKGYGPILFETVGVGQSEVEVIERTDPGVVVVAPGFGAGDRVFRVN